MYKHLKCMYIITSVHFDGKSLIDSCTEDVPNEKFDQLTRTIDENKTWVGEVRRNLENEVEKNKILETNLDRLDGSLKEIRGEINTQRMEDGERLAQMTRNVEKSRNDLKNNEAENKRLDNLLTQKEERIETLERKLVEVQYYAESDKIRSTNTDLKIKEIENINDNMKSKIGMQITTMLCTFAENGLTGIGAGLPIISVPNLDLGSETDVYTSGYNSRFTLRTSTPMYNMQNDNYVRTVDNQNVLSQNVENSGFTSLASTPLQNMNPSCYAMTEENQNDPSQNIEEVKNSNMQDNAAQTGRQDLSQEKLEEVGNDGRDNEANIGEERMELNTEDGSNKVPAEGPEASMEGRMELNTKDGSNTVPAEGPEASMENLEAGDNDGRDVEASVDLTGVSEYDSDGDRGNVNATEPRVTEWKDFPEELQKTLKRYNKNESMAKTGKLNSVQRAFVKYFVSERVNPNNKKTISLRNLIEEGCLHGIFHKNQRIGDSTLKEYLQSRMKYELKIQAKLSMKDSQNSNNEQAVLD